MPAFGFKARFEAPIVARVKRQTVRATLPKGLKPHHWAPLYIGLRTRSCRLIGSARIRAATPIRIDPERAIIWVWGQTFETARTLDAFALDDGFADWADMKAFWDQTHPGVAEFVGVLICWSDFTREYHAGRGGMSAQGARAPSQAHTGRYVALPPCNGCGEIDSAPYGFAPPGWPSVQNFCPDCTPSRTGSPGLPTATPTPARAGAQSDLFGRAR